MREGRDYVSKPLYKRKILRTIIAAILALGLLTAWAFYRGLTVRQYTVSSYKLNHDDVIRIVLITDLHSCIYGENQKDIISVLAAQKPDLILLGGDIADDVNPLEGTIQFLKGIKGLAPSFYVSGSHDMWRADYPQVKTLFASYGVTVMEGDIIPLTIRGQQINLCGIQDPDVPYQGRSDLFGKALYNAFHGLEEDAYNILLAHRPDFIDLYRQYPFDLVLSGHTHGGQVRIPLLINGLYAPNQGWYPKYAGGLYQAGDTAMIVSRGVSYYPKLPRIFNPPEVVMVKLGQE